MKKLNCLKPLLYIACMAFFANSCTKYANNSPELIGVSTELSAYEKYAEDINSGRIDSSTYIVTQDGGSIYYSNNTICQDTIWNVKNTIVCKLDRSNKLVWTYTFGDCNGHSDIYNIMEMVDGSIIFIGNRSRFTEAIEGDNFSFVKLSNNGKLLWEKKFDKDTHPYLICQTKDNGFLIPYYSAIYDVFPYKYFLNFVKMDQNGIVEWKKSDEGPEVPRCLIQTDDNGYLAVVEVDTLFHDRSRILKLDQNCNILKSTLLSSGFIWASDIIRSNDDGHILAAYYYDYISGQKLILNKINNNGEIIWTKEYPNVFNGVPNKFRIMKLFNTGYFIVTSVNISENVKMKSLILEFNNNGDLIK